MRKSRLSRIVQRRLIEHFVAGTTARCAASLVGVNVKTACYYHHRLRVIISLQLEKESGEVFKGEVEVDESYFGGTRKGKRGRGTGGKVPVFGVLKRSGRVYTKIISDASSRTLLPIIESKVVPIASFILTVGRGIIRWMYQSLNTIESTIQRCLQTSKTISME